MNELVNNKEKKNVFSHANAAFYVFSLNFRLQRARKKNTESCDVEELKELWLTKRLPRIHSYGKKHPKINITFSFKQILFCNTFLKRKSFKRDIIDVMLKVSFSFYCIKAGKSYQEKSVWWNIRNEDFFSVIDTLKRKVLKGNWVKAIPWT